MPGVAGCASLAASLGDETPISKRDLRSGRARRRRRATRQRHQVQLQREQQRRQRLRRLEVQRLYASADSVGAATRPCGREVRPVARSLHHPRHGLTRIFGAGARHCAVLAHCSQDDPASQASGYWTLPGYLWSTRTASIPGVALHVLAESPASPMLHGSA
jgi:hypothetical protein